MILFQLVFDDGVIVPVNESILVCLVLDNTHLGIHVVLHLEVIAVQMVWSDVQQHGNIGTEVIHIVELEGTEFNDIIFMRVLRNLQSQ